MPGSSSGGAILLLAGQGGDRPRLQEGGLAGAFVPASRDDKTSGSPDVVSLKQRQRIGRTALRFMNYDQPQAAVLVPSLQRATIGLVLTYAPPFVTIAAVAFRRARLWEDASLGAHRPAAGGGRSPAAGPHRWKTMDALCFPGSGREKAWHRGHCSSPTGIPDFVRVPIATARSRGVRALAVSSPRRPARGLHRMNYFVPAVLRAQSWRVHLN